MKSEICIVLWTNWNIPIVFAYKKCIYIYIFMYAFSIYLEFCHFLSYFVKYIHSIYQNILSLLVVSVKMLHFLQIIFYIILTSWSVFVIYFAFWVHDHKIFFSLTYITSNSLFFMHSLLSLHWIKNTFNIKFKQVVNQFTFLLAKKFWIITVWIAHNIA